MVAFMTFDSSAVIQRSIGRVYPYSWFFFVAFLILVSIGAMELMTSLFIEALLEEKRRTEQEEKEWVEERRQQVEQLIIGLFEVFDVDDSKALERDELLAVMQVFDDPDA